MAEMVALENAVLNFSWYEVPFPLRDWVTATFPAINSESRLRTVAKAQFGEPKASHRRRDGQEPTRVWHCVQFLWARQQGLLFAQKGSISKGKRGARRKERGLNKSQQIENANAERKDLIVKAGKVAIFRALHQTNKPLLRKEAHQDASSDTQSVVRPS
jgi:hypothetical protein